MRTGGFSKSPYSSLNLGLSTKDDPNDVAHNRHQFFNAIGINEKNIASSGQVHGKAILIAEKAGRYQGYDAIVTNNKNLFVAVSIADCCPILLYDKVHHAVAAIHAGWRGTVTGIVRETLCKMQSAFGTEGADTLAYIGTCIAAKSFEVGADVASQFDNRFISVTNTSGKFLADIKTANLQQLLDFGVPLDSIEISPYCTVLNNNEYFSYRKEGQESGRMLAVIGVKKN